MVHQRIFYGTLLIALVVGGVCLWRRCCKAQQQDATAMKAPLNPQAPSSSP